jgi:hypothetical protein
MTDKKINPIFFNKIVIAIQVEQRSSSHGKGVNLKVNGEYRCLIIGALFIWNKFDGNRVKKRDRTTNV